jgi:hypothetical protein
MHLFAKITVPADVATSSITPCEAVFAIEFASDVSMRRFSLLNMPKSPARQPEQGGACDAVGTALSGQPLLSRRPPL